MTKFLDFMRMNWLWIFSFSTFMMGVMVWVYVRLKAVQLGLQALLRGQMINEYRLGAAKGHVSIDDKQNFENMWIQYEHLGKNGVMKGIHDKYMKLPEE